MLTKTNTKNLTAKEKAAVLLICLGKEYANELRKHFTDAEFGEITACLSAARRISPQERALVVKEFYEMCLAQKLIHDGGIAYALGILEKALGSEKADSLIYMLSSAERKHTFDFIVSGETAKVLEYTPVAFDMAEQINSDGVALAGMFTKFREMPENRYPDGAEIYNAAVFDSVTRTQPVFEDIAKLSDSATLRLLRDISSTDLAVTLKLADEEITASVFGSLPKGLREAIKAEMDVLGPVRVRDVEDAQKRIADAIARLEDTGEIVVPRGITAAFIA